ncbi:molybdopterin-dependent oxidoreductase [Hoyosella subflava]|uniref:Putative oxidoreductase n=1 Tax=Hoyosella subflava (strain DSM 45089 / JCM 17490 / NBRC 109087 / DQS3-9A1) TaxID=443218 RepID=F6EHB3_HOYSD|nr:molybdopterin-dependent oxidoreductase [Hoyosella subflava]AEF41092.1 Putative oxidoreductase [Hoyosella subflava DQS3-9A1]
MPDQRTVNRQCTLCEAHCGIQVTTEGQRVTFIEGDPADVMSRGYICPKATALAGLHHDPDRLRTPMRRNGDTFEPITWDAAFAEIGQRLRATRKQHGPSSIAMYLGNPAAHSPSVMYGLLLRAALLTRNFYSASSVDQFPQEFAAWRMFGSSFLMPVADIDRTQRLVILGANPAVSNGSVTTMPNAKKRIRDVRRRGGKVVVIDPRRTETARIADEHVAIDPGGDPYLLLAMLHVLNEEKLVDSEVVERNLSGWDELCRLTSEVTPEFAAARCGVDAEVIRRLAREHAAASSAVVYARIGVCQHTTGTITHWLVNVINAVTGNVDRPGGQMYTTPPVDAMRWLRWLPIPYGNWTDRSGTRKAFRFELPVSGLAQDIINEGPGRIRAMITYAGNPVLSTPQRGKLAEALTSLDFYVAVDMYVTETTRHADIILPPVSPLEREEFDVLFPIFSVRNNARYNARVFDTPDEGLEDWEILARLVTEVTPLPLRRFTGELLNGVFSRVSPLRIAAVGVALGPHGLLRRGTRGITIKKIKDTPGGIDLGPLQPRLAKLIRTKDRRVQLAPPDLIAEARHVVNAPSPRSTKFDLRLIGRRHLRSNNSWLHNVPTMVKGRDRCTVLMHPADAATRNLTAGQRVDVTSPVGTITVPVEVSSDIVRGTVAIPHGWGHHEGATWSVAAQHPGANVNLLHDPEVGDTFTGNGGLNSTSVHIEAAAKIVT